MRITSSIILVLIPLSVSARAHDIRQKKVVGATEVIRIGEGNLDFKARVDTGAQTCSVHAVDIEVDQSGDPKGKPISFRVVNKDGQSAKVATRVDSVVTVRTAEGSERRYKVPLTFVWNESRKTVLVTLNDRQRMTYRVLLGRNWLRRDFLVDVDMNNED